MGELKHREMKVVLGSHHRREYRFIHHSPVFSPLDDTSQAVRHTANMSRTKTLDCFSMGPQRV